MRAGIDRSDAWRGEEWVAEKALGSMRGMGGVEVVSVSRACLALAGIAAVVAIAADDARAQGALSDKLIQQIEEARKAAKARKFDDALEIYDRAAGEASAAQAEQIRNVLVNRASLYEYLQQFSDAEADLTKALNVRPVDPNIYADRGYFYMRRNRMPDALSDFLSGARLAPDNAKFFFGAGRVQSALNNFPAAIDFYSDAIAADPASARAYLARAEAQVRLGRWSEARADYDRALALGLERRPDQYFARLGRGYVLLMLEQYTPAVADFDVALSIEPTAAKGLMWRGYANEKRGRLDLAISDFERAASIDRRDSVARQNRDRLRSRSAAAPGPLAPADLSAD